MLHLQHFLSLSTSKHFVNSRKKLLSSPDGNLSRSYIKYFDLIFLILLTYLFRFESEFKAKRYT